MLAREEEQARQIGCVVQKLRNLMETKVKGSLTVHLDGSGLLGRNFETHLFEWRDGFGLEKQGMPMTEEEFIAMLTK